MKTIKISTPRIIEASEIVSILQNNLSQVMRQNFWQKQVSMSGKVEYLKQIAYARSNLWKIVNEEYPETKEKNVSVNSTNISWENN